MLSNNSKCFGIIFSLLLLYSRQAVADVDAPCYAPNGARAEGFLPCDPTAYITACCPIGWTCYSNNMCVITDPRAVDSSHPVGTSQRGSCTNPVWNNAVCGDYCLGGGSSEGGLRACGDNMFCCADDESCSCSDGAFRINPGIVQTIIGVEGLEHTETSTMAIRTLLSSTASASTSERDSGTAVTTFVTGTLSTAAGPPTTAVVVAKKTIDKPAVKAGIAVGVIIGSALVGGILWFIWFSSRQKYDLVKPTSEPARPPSATDPYRPGNAASLMFNLPIPERTESSQGFYGSRGPRAANSTTTIGSGTLHAGYGGLTGVDRPLSIVSDEEEIRYGRLPRVTEMGS